jgi:hypothetical protein
MLLHPWVGHTTRSQFASLTWDVNQCSKHPSQTSFSWIHASSRGKALGGNTSPHTEHSHKLLSGSFAKDSGVTVLVMDNRDSDMGLDRREAVLLLFLNVFLSRHA